MNSAITPSKHLGMTAIGDENQYARVDEISGALITIPLEHHEIHDGDFYQIRHFAASKNDGETINAYIKTPNTTEACHVYAKWGAGGAGMCRIQEAPTVTVNTGTGSQTARNHNRSLDGVSTFGCYDNSTVPQLGKYSVDVTMTTTGAGILMDYSGAAKSSGGSGRNEAEFVLKPNTAYVFVVESDAAGIALSLAVDMYLHAPMGTLALTN